MSSLVETLAAADHEAGIIDVKAALAQKRLLQRVRARTVLAIVSFVDPSEASQAHEFPNSASFCGFSVSSFAVRIKTFPGYWLQPVSHATTSGCPRMCR